MPDTALRPAFASVPEWRTTFGDLAAEMGSLVGLTPDGEQRLVLDAIFAEDDGTPTCFETAIIAPRQNLKTAALEVAALTDLFLFDVELHVWTAHLSSTARKAFDDMCRLIDAVPDLRRRCRPHRMAAGQETIERRSGERIEFHARSKGGGRGFTGDKVTLDEALFLTGPMLGALLPTMATRKGAQVRYGSSAGLLESETLRGVRDRGRPGTDSGLAWFEWCAEHRDCQQPKCMHSPGTPGCALDDEDLWQQANPALGRRISIALLRRFRKAMPPGEFAREFLGWWDDPPAGGGVWSVDIWRSLTDMSAKLGETTPAFALEVGLQRASACVTAAWLHDGKPHVALARHEPGVEWVVDFLASACAKRENYGITLDGGSEAAAFIQPLEDAGVTVNAVRGADRAKACAGIFDAVNQRSMSHEDEPVLAAAVAGAVWRESTEGVRTFARRGDTDISPLYAFAFALAGLRQGADPALSVF